MNRSLFLGCALGFAMACVTAGAMSAQAADLPRQPAPLPYKATPAPAFRWTGFYLGINAGYAWGRSSWSDPLVGADSGRFHTSGALAGGQLGYNWQIGDAVLGIETDADWMNVTGSTPGFGGVCATDGGGLCQTKQSWIGTTRGRVGYAFDRWMPYVTGGVAYGNIQAVQPATTSSGTKVGWAAGAGMEVAIDRNWSAKAEFLHIDLGTEVLFGSASGTSTLAVPSTNNVVRGGINYRFGW